jgi:hypothetical protein
MRRLLPLLLGGLLLSGCAASHPTPVASEVPQHSYFPASSTALAFDPPIGAGMVPYLSRENRDVSAYGGFQSLSTETYDVQTDDDQLFFNNNSTYERRVVSDRVGVIFR